MSLELGPMPTTRYDPDDNGLRLDYTGRNLWSETARALLLPCVEDSGCVFRISARNVRGSYLAAAMMGRVRVQQVGGR